VLTGLGAQANPVALIPKAASIHGVFVGSRAMFANVLDAVATHLIKPVIDRQFAFAEALAALAHMKSGGHFGKTVIRVGS
jgi:NADPH:quinone reductase-like Zn-dependent oxidoreductase